MSIGYKIKKIRELKNLNQMYFSKALGISQSTYSRYENGNKLPVHLLSKIADLLEIEMEDILRFNTKKHFINSSKKDGNTQNTTTQSELEYKISKLEERVKHLESRIYFIHQNHLS